MAITSDERYCPICGTRLTTHEQPEDGLVPWCPTCNEYRYPKYNVAVSVIVQHPSEPKVLTIDQYGKEGILVAGYITRGEAAEDTVAREVDEAHWIPRDEVLDAMRPHSLARRFVARWLEGQASPMV